MIKFISSKSNHNKRTDETRSINKQKRSDNEIIEFLSIEIKTESEQDNITRIRDA